MPRHAAAATSAGAAARGRPRAVLRARRRRARAEPAARAPATPRWSAASSCATPACRRLVGRYVFGDQSKATVLSAALGGETTPRAETRCPSIAADVRSARTAAAASTSPRSTASCRGSRTAPCHRARPAARPRRAPRRPAAPRRWPRGCGLRVRSPARPAGRAVIRLRLRAARACAVTLRAPRLPLRRVALVGRAGPESSRITPSRTRCAGWARHRGPPGPGPDRHAPRATRPATRPVSASDPARVR